MNVDLSIIITYAKYDVRKLTRLNDFGLYLPKMCDFLVQQGLLKAWEGNPNLT